MLKFTEIQYLIYQIQQSAYIFLDYFQVIARLFRQLLVFQDFCHWPVYQCERCTEFVADVSKKRSLLLVFSCSRARR